MKIKCPYCDQISEWKKNQCPSCGKFALMPGFMPPKERRKRTYRRERKSSVSSPWLLNGGLWNIFGNLAKLPRWVLWLSVICVAGAYFQVSTYQFEQPEAVSKAKDNISVLNTALDYFFRDCGRYPSTEEGLSALAANPNVPGWKGPYIQKLKWDSWKHPFFYASNGETFNLLSLGPDGLKGTADDVLTSDRFVPVEETVKEISVSVEDLKGLKKDMPKPDSN